MGFLDQGDLPGLTVYHLRELVQMASCGDLFKECEGLGVGNLGQDAKVEQAIIEPGPGTRSEAAADGGLSPDVAMAWATPRARRRATDRLSHCCCLLASLALRDAADSPLLPLLPPLPPRHVRACPHCVCHLLPVAAAGGS